MPADNRNILHSPLLGLWLPSISQLPCLEMLLGTNGGPRHRVIHHSPGSQYSYSHSSRRWVRMHQCRDLHWLGRKTNGIALIIAVLQLFLTPSLMPSPLGHSVIEKGSQGAAREDFIWKKCIFKNWVENPEQFNQKNIPTSLRANADAWIHPSHCQALPRVPKAIAMTVCFLSSVRTHKCLQPVPNEDL